MSAEAPQSIKEAITTVLEAKLFYLLSPKEIADLRGLLRDAFQECVAQKFNIAQLKADRVTEEAIKDLWEAIFSERY